MAKSVGVITGFRKINWNFKGYLQLVILVTVELERKKES
jgi:hypothetical protein